MTGMSGKTVSVVQLFTLRL